jgi:DNA-binding MarR family transcriptional regulator
VVTALRWGAVVTSDDVPGRLAAAVERLGVAARTLLRRSAADHGLSVAQAEILLRLGAAEPRPGVGGLSAWLDVSQASVSDSVTALHRKGLVDKAGHGRTVHLTPTAAGLAVLAGLQGWDRPLRRALGAAGEAPAGTTLDLLLRAIADLQAQGVVTVARTCVSCRHFRPRERAGDPHHCALLRLPLAETDLRVDCSEHERA